MDHSGWLLKRSPRPPLHSLQRRYFLLHDGDISYFRSIKDEKPRGVIPLRCAMPLNTQHLGRPYDNVVTFCCRCRSALKDLQAKDRTLQLDVGYRTFTLVARTESELRAWVDAIEGSGPAKATLGSMSAVTNTRTAFTPSYAATEVESPQRHVRIHTSERTMVEGASSSGVPRDRAESRPGVLCEGVLLKSPPNLSLRRVSEEKRLQQRWCVRSARSAALAFPSG